MIIRKIYMENLFSHKKTEIEFDRGLTAIVGPNGAGKSSIIEAIFLALFDSGSQMSQEILRTGRSKKGVVRIGASGALVALDFETGGKLYRVRREYDADGGSRSHVLLEIRDGRELVIARGVSEVTRYISRILGAEDPRIFTSTIFSRQDMLSQILDMSPSERKSKILSLLGLKDLEDARDLVREAANKAERILGEISSDESNLKKLREALERDKRERQRLEAELETETRRMGELEARRGDIASKLEVIEKLISIQREAEDLEKIGREAETLEKEIDRINAKLDSLRSAGLDLEAIRRLGAIYRASSECLKKEDQLRRRFKLYEESINRAKIEISSEKVKRDLETMGIDASLQPEEILSRLENIAGSMERRLGEVRGLLNMYRKILDLRPEGNKCPFCGRELDREAINHISETHRNEIERLEGEEKKIMSDIEKLRSVRSKLEAGLRQLREYSAKLEEIARELGDVEKCASDVKELCSSLIDRLRTAGFDEYSGLSCHEILGLIEGESVRLIERKEILERRLGEIKATYDPARLEDLRRSIKEIIEGNAWMGESNDYNALRGSLEKERDKIQREIETLRTRIGVIRGNLEMLAKNIAEREKEISVIEERVRKKPSVENALKILRIFEKKILGGEGLIAQALVQLVVKSLEEEVNRSLSAFSRDFAVEIESDFSINIKTASGGVLGINSLSGGERTMLAIAFRIALARILLGRLPSIMILDEPTQNLDVENKSRLFDIIKDIAGFLDQVIVVTHDEEIIEKADRIIRVDNENGISRAYIQATHTADIG